MGNQKNKTKQLQSQKPITMQIQNQQSSTESYRMALRRYQCYGCERQFGTMVNVEGPNDVKCSACGSDFVEEMRSV